MFLILGIVLALEVIEQIPDFLLNPEENYYLSLYDYFSGDYLYFTTDNPEITIVNSKYSHLNQNIFTFPNKTNQVNELFTLVNLLDSSYFIVPYDNCILVYLYNGTDPVSQPFYVEPIFGDFIEINGISSFEYENSVFLIISTMQIVNSSVPTSQFYIGNFSEMVQRNATAKLVHQTMWDLYYANEAGLTTQQSLICQTNNYMIPIVYYQYGIGKIFIYEYLDSANLVLKHTVRFQGNSVMFCFLVTNYFYVINDENVIYEYSFQSNSITILTTYSINTNQTLLSFTLSNYNELLITTENTFIYLKSEFNGYGELVFDQTYQKIIQTPYKNFVITGVMKLLEYFIFLGNTEKSSFILVAQIAEGYPILSEFPIPDTAIRWCAFNSYNVFIEVFIANSTMLSVYQIDMGALSTAHITYDCFGNNSITATELYSEEIISENFNVIQSDPYNPNSLYFIGNLPIIIDIGFNDLVGSGILNISEYFFGPCVSFSSITYENSTEVSSVTNSYINFLDLFQESKACIGYDNFVVFQESVIFYNRTSYQNVTESESLCQETGTFPEDVLQIYSYGDCLYLYIRSIEYKIVKVYSLESNFSISFSAKSQLISITFTISNIVLVYPSEIEIYQYDDLERIEVISNSGKSVAISFSNFIYILTDSSIEISNLGVPVSSIAFNCTSYTDISVNSFDIYIYNTTEISVLANSGSNINKAILFPGKASCIGSNNETFAVVINSTLYLYNISNNAMNSLLQIIEIGSKSICQLETCNIEITPIIENRLMYIFLFCPPFLNVFAYEVLGNYLNIEVLPNHHSIINTNVVKMNAELDIISQLDEAIYTISAEIQLLINGELFYIDYAALNASNNPKIECNTRFAFSLDNIAIGQSVKFELNQGGISPSGCETPAEIKVSEKAENNNFFYCEFENIEDLDVSTDGKCVIAVSGNQILICNVDTNLVLSYNFERILLKSVKFISLIKNIITVLIGYEEYFLLDSYWKAERHLVNIQNYALGLVKIDLTKNIYILNQTAIIQTSPDQIKVLRSAGDTFAFAVFNTFLYVEPGQSYSNSLLIGIFYEEKFNFVPFDFISFGLSSVYIIDLAIQFDPLFGTFYIYISDFNAGIRVFSINEPYQFVYHGLTAYKETIMNLVINGYTLHANTITSTVLYYKLVNYLELVLQNEVISLNTGFVPCIGTFAVVQSNDAGYLAQLIANDQTYVLQIVDNYASNTTDIFLDYDLPDSLGQLQFVKFLNNTTLFLQFENTILPYVLGESTANVIQYPECCPGEYSQNISASYNNVNHTIPLHYSIYKKKSNENELNNYDFSDITIILLVVLPTFSIIVAFVIYKYCFKKRRAERTEPLFVYAFKEFEKDL